MMSNIIFYAPTGKGLPAHMLGGGERGCRRTKEILETNGYSVYTVEKPNNSEGLFKYGLNALKAIVEYVALLIKKDKALVYTVGFYEKNLPLEYVVLKIAKIFGRTTVYEARNGRLVGAYNEGGKLYKKLMEATLKMADTVFAQGAEYLPLIHSVTGKEGVYTPNYVLNKNTVSEIAPRPTEQLNLIYFGRVSKSKNIDVVIKVHQHLRLQGYPVHTSIIGGISPEYQDELNSLLCETDKGEITFWGAQEFPVIAQELNKAHFFVFPSSEKMEGHSNSLTEAMTYGVVPIVSTAGFNASIVGNRDLVVEDLEPVKYADIICRIVENKQWKEYSSYVFERIKNNYTEDIVRNRILNAIERCIKG